MAAPKIFISYAREDEASARRLYEELKRAGAQPWLDKENLLPGQEWEATIEMEIEKCDYFIALFSSASISKRGYVQKELRRALDVLDTIPPNQVFVIPVRINACEPLHLKLRKLSWVDLFPSWETGVKRIQLALEIEKTFPAPTPTPKNILSPSRTSKSIPSVQPSSKIRIQFDFSAESMSKLDELVQHTNSGTRAEVIRQALTLYTYLLEAENRGDKALLKKQSGDLLEILLLRRY
jgi:hypothetical protein